MKVFIGSSNKNLVEEKVLIYTLIEKAKIPASDIFILDATTKKIKSLSGDEHEINFETPKGSTEFSWARFTIPEFCEFKDIAIYLDSDIVVNESLEPLSELVAETDFACVAVKNCFVGGLYKKRILSNPIIRSLENPFLTSVLVFNNEKLRNRFSLKEIGKCYDQKELSYVDIMFFSKKFLNRYGFSVSAISPLWNCLDCKPQGFKIVHFTDLKTQPWFSLFNPAGNFWYKLYLNACEKGYVRNIDLEKSLAVKTLSSRVLQMPYRSYSRKENIKYYLLFLRDIIVESPSYVYTALKEYLMNFYYSFK